MSTGELPDLGHRVFPHRRDAGDDLPIPRSAPRDSGLSQLFVTIFKRNAPAGPRSFAAYLPLQRVSPEAVPK